MSGATGHWNDIYRRKSEAELSWHEPVPQVSLDLIRRLVPPGSSIIDIGGGTSRLAEVLLRQGYGPLAVLDISAAAIEANQKRLGGDASRITWIASDVGSWEPDRVWDLWHDRAVFHFLTGPADQAAYVARMRQALKPGGLAIIATFDSDGPERCSGLPVLRQSSSELAARLNRLAPGRLAPVQSRHHIHATPGGARQSFQYSVFRIVD